MMNKNILIFFRFLKKENAFTLYCKNINNEEYRLDNKYIISNYKDFLNASRSINFINYAFMWRKTKEGYSFWEDINKKWINFLEKYDLFY